MVLSSSPTLLLLDPAGLPGVSSVQWEVTLWLAFSLTSLGPAGEEVGGHLPLALHLDHATVVQLVAAVHQHVLQIRCYLGDYTDTGSKN